MEQFFARVKYSGQGSYKVKKGTIDKTFIFTENHRHLPIASVNDPLMHIGMVEFHVPFTGHCDLKLDI